MVDVGGKVFLWDYSSQPVGVHYKGHAMTQDHDKPRPLCDDKKEELRSDCAKLKAMYLKALNGHLPDQADYRVFCDILRQVEGCVRI